MNSTQTKLHEFREAYARFIAGKRLGGVFASQYREPAPADFGLRTAADLHFVEIVKRQAEREACQ